jgi:DNA adenine methylase
LAKVTSHCTDALEVIRAHDTPDILHYGDPPYYNSQMGHYVGYMLADCIALLDCFAVVKGKFLRSSSPHVKPQNPNAKPRF